MSEIYYKKHPIYHHINIPVGEVWRPVVGYETAYQVSSRGRVRSLDRLVRRGSHFMHMKGKYFSLFSKESGHMMLVLRGSEGGKTRYVHSLVLEAFVGNCPEGMEASHLDGDPQNNRIDNLCWETHADNILRKIQHGTSGKGCTNPKTSGELNGFCSITDEEVREIHRLYSTGRFTMKEVAVKFGTDATVVCDIVNSLSRKTLNLSPVSGSIKKNNILRTRRRGENVDGSVLKDGWIPHIR